MDSGPAPFRSLRELNHQFRRSVYELGAYLNDRRIGHRQPYRFCQPRGKQLIGEDSNVLRIILELDDVQMIVGAQHQMRLCSPAHPSKMLDGRKWHAYLRRRSMSMFFFAFGGRTDRRSPGKLYSQAKTKALNSAVTCLTLRLWIKSQIFIMGHSSRSALENSDLAWVVVVVEVVLALGRNPMQGSPSPRSGFGRRYKIPARRHVED